MRPNRNNKHIKTEVNQNEWKVKNIPYMYDTKFKRYILDQEANGVGERMGCARWRG